MTDRASPFRWTPRSIAQKVAVTVLLPFILNACDGVVGGGLAEFEVFVVPDGAEPVEVEGSLTTRLRISLNSSDGFPVDISAGEQELTLSLQQSAPEELGTVSVFQGIYQGVSAYFTEVEGQVEVDGESVSVRVDFGDEESLRKEDPSQLLARNDERLAVTVDLGAAEWIDAAEAEGPEGDLVVPAAAFLDAVRIVVELR